MKKIKNKMLLTILPLVILLLLTLTGIVAFYFYLSERDNVYNRNLLTSRSYASEIDSFIRRYDSIAETFAFSQTHYSAKNRGEVLAMLKEVIENDSNIVGFDVGYEPELFDGKDKQFINHPGHDGTGRFIPYWNRLKGNLVLEPLMNVDESEWYTVPKKTKKVFGTSPFIYDGILMMSICYPILKKGEFQGIVGLDLSMETVKKLLKEFENKKLYHSNYALLVGQDGLLVASSNKDYDEKQITANKTLTQLGNELEIPEFHKLFEEIKNRKEGFLKTRDAITGENVILFYSPVKAGNFQILISISNSDLLEHTIQTIYILFAISFIFLLVLAPTVYIVISNIVNPLNELTEIVYKFGKKDRSVRSFIETNDEIGELSKTFNSMANSIEEYSNELEAQKLQLEERVVLRTSELQTSNKKLESTLNNLQETQTQLIQSEKMSSLGQLVANVAHEINTPIGVVKASGKNIADALEHAIGNMPKLFQILEEQPRGLFTKLVSQNKEQTDILSSREERSLIRDTTRKLEEVGVQDARTKAEYLVQLQAHSIFAEYLPLLHHVESDFIFRTANSIATIVNSTGNINLAVDKVSKIIFALKSFSRVSSSDEMTSAELKDGIEVVLTMYQSQLRQGVELVRQYEDIPPFYCLPDELNQVWTNLIHNAVQAMKDKGVLTVGIHRVEKNALVTIGDTGSGIPEAIRGKIFDPFFTTKPVGEGSGLGLHIVKKIIDKHNGRIEVQSEVGVGSVFSVYLPMKKER